MTRLRRAWRRSPAKTVRHHACSARERRHAAGSSLSVSASADIGGTSRTVPVSPGGRLVEVGVLLRDG
ncbi:hypothetical protein [Spongiactinospora sp. 9N601]|uniref:hypothetical protein n=1 Tax=Spongiactinospora sp. 9N601 TaxID=3375149 RepID=UPI0037AE6069